MALKITNECINCDVCEEVCPNKAIYFGKEIFEIDPKLCTECMGHTEIPACQEICPVSCIIKDNNHPESKEQLLKKYHSLQS